MDHLEGIRLIRKQLFSTAGKKSVLTVGRVPKIAIIAGIFEVSVKQGVENLNLIFSGPNSAKIPLPVSVTLIPFPSGKLAYSISCFTP